MQLNPSMEIPASYEILDAKPDPGKKRMPKQARQLSPQSRAIIDAYAVKVFGSFGRQLVREIQKELRFL